VGNPPAFIIGMMFGPTHGAAYASAVTAAGLAIEAEARGGLGRAFTAHDRTVHAVLWRAQLAVLEDLPRARHAAMQAVLDANYPGGQPMMSGAALLDRQLLSDDLPTLLTPRLGDERSRLRDLVLQAAGNYSFLDARNHTV